MLYAAIYIYRKKGIFYITSKMDILTNDPTVFSRFVRHNKIDNLYSSIIQFLTKQDFKENFLEYVNTCILSQESDK